MDGSFQINYFYYINIENNYINMTIKDNLHKNLMKYKYKIIINFMIYI